MRQCLAARQDQIRFEPLRAYQDIPAVFTWAIPDIHAYAAATSMAHSHSMWRPETDELIRAFSHRVLIIRDLRDVAVSWLRWIFTPFNRLHRPTVHATAEALLVDDLPRRVTAPFCGTTSVRAVCKPCLNACGGQAGRRHRSQAGRGWRARGRR